MRLSKQININNCSSLLFNYKNVSTSNLMNSGLIARYELNAIPLFTPLGKIIIDNIENLMSSSARKLGMEKIDLPSIMGNETLEAGQEIGNIFKNKIIYLSEDIKGTHLLTSPETLLINILSDNNLSYKQLPLVYFYNNNFFRNMSDYRNLLRSKQFKMFGAMSFDIDIIGTKNSAEMFDKFTKQIFKDFNLPIYNMYNSVEMKSEYFYLSENGKESVRIPELDKDKNTKALSLAMYYKYQFDKPLRLKYRDKNNKKINPVMLTYGLGIQRALFSIMDHNRDELGFNLPKIIRPFDVIIIPDKDKNKTAANTVYTKLLDAAIKVGINDITTTNTKVRQKFSSFLSSPYNAIFHNNGVNLYNRKLEKIMEFYNLEDFIANLVPSKFTYL